MVVRDDCVKFTVLGQEIKIYSENLGNSYSTVADMGDHYHYLGNECPTVTAAIFAWQEVNGRDLTNEELRQVLVDNYLISEAI